MQESLLDFGAAGKGYLVDLLAELLLEHGVDNFVIDAGGDIRQHTNEHQGRTIVALENPHNPMEAIGSVSLHNGSICGSAPNRRQWGEWHHIIDPHSLQPTRDKAATWAIVADTERYPTMLADGLATALFFVSSSRLTDFDFDYLVVKADNSYSISKNLPCTIYV